MTRAGTCACPALCAALIGALVAACGGAAAPAPAEHGPRCGASCDRIDVRGPVLCAQLAPGHVGVLVAGADAHLRFGIAEVSEGRWRPRSLGLAPALAGARPPLSAAVDAGDLLVLHATEAGVALSRLGPGGESLVTTLSQTPPASLALARAPDGKTFALWVPAGEGALAPSGALLRDGELAPLTLPVQAHPDGRVAAAVTTLGLVAAYATRKGVQVAGGSVQGALVLSEEPAHGVAVAAQGERAWVAWAEPTGVRVALLRDGAQVGETTTVDGGERTGEPARAVGAGLTMILDAEDPILGYQDQTAGDLVTARVGARVTRRGHADARWTRAFSVGLASAGGSVFVLDVALRARPEVRGELFVTRL